MGPTRPLQRAPLNPSLTRVVFQVEHPDLVETLAIDRASTKINNREKNLGAILFFCPTGGMQFHLKIRIFGHSA